MGSSSSQSTTIKEFQKSTTAIATQQAVKSIVENKSNCNILNNIEIVAGQTSKGVACQYFVGGNFNVSQNANNVCQFTASGLAQTQANATQDIRNTLQQIADSNNKSVQQFLSLAAHNTQDTNIDTKSEVINTIANSISIEDINQCISNATITQNQKLYLCGIFYGDVNLSQNAVQKSIAACNSQLINNAIVNNKALNDIAQKVISTQDSQQQGVFSPILALLDTLNNLFSQLKGFAYAAILIGIAILIIALVIFLIFGPAKLLFKKKTDQVPNKNS